MSLAEEYERKVNLLEGVVIKEKLDLYRMVIHEWYHTPNAVPTKYLYEIDMILKCVQWEAK